jgi:hypothetical protein
VIAEYVWIDSTGGTRSKSRVGFSLSPHQYETLPSQNYRMSGKMSSLPCAIFGPRTVSHPQPQDKIRLLAAIGATLATYDVSCRECYLSFSSLRQIPRRSFGDHSPQISTIDHVCIVIAQRKRECEVGVWPSVARLEPRVISGIFKQQLHARDNVLT